MQDRTGQEPRPHRWAWRLGGLAGVGLLDPEHVDVVLAMRGIRPGGCA